MVALRTRVYRRWRRLALAVLPAVVLFVIWDLYAIGAGHWYFDARRMPRVVFAGGPPLEELLFFLVIPVAAILTLEAVRSATGWRVGDEPAGDPARERGPGDRHGEQTVGVTYTAWHLLASLSSSCSDLPCGAHAAVGPPGVLVVYAIIVFFQLLTNSIAF